jgi:membrane-associated phospholipid phosphatase
MSKVDRFVWLQVAIGAALLVAGLLGLDRLLAESLRASGLEGLWVLEKGTVFFDTVTGKDVSKFLVGLLLTMGGLALLIAPRSRVAGRNTLFVGLVQLSGTLVTGVSKNVFGRLRPFELLQSGDWNHAWFVGGNAFPSGHTGFYFGLFLPLACLFPRWRWPLVLVPWFIAVARVNANHHFLSDVGASIVMVGLLALLLGRLVLPRSDRGRT